MTMFGQGALSVIIGLCVIQMIRWILHFLKG